MITTVDINDKLRIAELAEMGWVVWKYDAITVTMVWMYLCEESEMGMELMPYPVAAA